MSVYTSQFSITDQWTEVGTAPMTVELLTPGVAVYIVASDAEPDSDEYGWVLAGGITEITVDVTQATSVWARTISGDAKLAVMLQATSGGGGGGSSNSEVSNLYRVTTAFVDANGNCAIDDVLENILTISPTRTVISSAWIDTAAGFTLAATPSSADIALLGSNPLTNSQFQGNFPLPSDLNVDEWGM